VADDIALTALPVGSTFKLKGKITADTGTTMTVDLLQADGTTHGHIDITIADGTLTGALTVDLADTAVEPVAIALDIEDVVMEQSTGRTRVVRAVGLGPDGDRWSDTTAGTDTYPSEGWTRIGTATIT
jgi:hypothetical protein